MKRRRFHLRDPVRARWRLAKAVPLLCLVIFSGCVQRFIEVTSEPPGARVTVNGYNVGVTPTGPVYFDYYGVYEILLEKNGYEPLLQREHLKTPWHSRFPLDFFTECLWPGKIIDRHSLQYRLKPATAADRKGLSKRARGVHQQKQASRKQKKKKQKERR